MTTKTGDDGKSRFGGRVVDKDSVELEAMGELDELMAVIGIAIEYNQDIKDDLYLMNHNLYLIMGMISGYGKKEDVKKMVLNIENKIRIIEKEKGDIKKFLKAGGELDIWLNHCRTVCRRAERRLVAFFKKRETGNEKLDKNILVFINRLSDYLFILGRKIK